MSDEERILKQLEFKFLEAIKAHQEENLDKAEQLNKAILKIEPRLVEPNVELSSIALRRDQLEEAMSYAEEAIRLCGLHGHWMDNFTDNELLSMAYCSLGESLRRQAEKDEVIFQEPQKFEILINKAKEAYQKAAEFDPENEFAKFWGGFKQKWRR